MTEARDIPSRLRAAIGGSAIHPPGIKGTSEFNLPEDSHGA